MSGKHRVSTHKHRRPILSNLLSPLIGKGRRQPVYYPPGIALNAFQLLMAATLVLIAFLLYDRWLYQNEYNKLVDAWVAGQGDQLAFDDLSLELKDLKNINKRLIAGKAKEIKLRLKSHERKLKSLNTPERYTSLAAAEEDLIEMNRYAYKFAQAQKEIAAELGSRKFDPKLASYLKKLNLNITDKEQDAARHLLANSPIDRRPLDGFADFLNLFYRQSKRVPHIDG